MVENGYKITNIKYEWNNPFYSNIAKQVGADCQAIGERLEQIAIDNGGEENVTAKMIVQDARDINSPLHTIIFRKTDEEAAELWREEEARKVQGSIQMHFTRESIEVDGTTSKKILFSKRAFQHTSDISRVSTYDNNLQKGKFFSITY